jgi:hypothetical protein
MAMYSAFFDESGQPDCGKFMAVAGAIADVAQWVEFEREWKLLLAPLGTETFHANEFHHRNPPYDALSETEADELFARLIGVICRRVEQTISKAIKLSEFNAMNDEYVLGELYGFPYGICARSAIGKVEEWAARHSVPIPEIKLFFEDGAKDKGQLEWIAERDGLLVPTRLPKQGNIPLQAGDLMSWCHKLHLSGVNLHTRYRRGLDRLYEKSAEWELLLFPDIDRLPTILDIPRRDPQYKYKCKIIRKDGKRHALVRYWPNKSIETKIDRKALQIPKRKTREEIMRAAAEYDAKTASM